MNREYDEAMIMPHHATPQKSGTFPKKVCNRDCPTRGDGWILNIVTRCCEHRTVVVSLTQLDDICGESMGFLNISSKTAR